MKLIASDMDRTLLPNGNHRVSKGAMNKLKKELKKNKVKVIFVTGRYESLIKDGIDRYNTPKPEYIISLLGTVVYNYKKGQFIKDKQWENILAKDWKKYKRQDIENLLSDIKELKVQPAITLNDYKQSYYYNPKINIKKLINKIKARLKNKGIKAEIIDSIDVNRNTGLLDIVPQSGTKLSALNYVIKKMKIKKSDVLYAGDSGNDLLPLASGVFGVLVKNASQKTKDKLIKIATEKKLNNKIHIAKGSKKLNGNYASGIIEAAYKFGFFKK